MSKFAEKVSGRPTVDDESAKKQCTLGTIYWEEPQNCAHFMVTSPQRFCQQKAHTQDYHKRRIFVANLLVKIIDKSCNNGQRELRHGLL
jgi:hypothetical protein